MKMKKLPYVIVLALPSMAFAAETTCTFTMECFETEACAETQFSVTLSEDQTTMVTDFGDLAVVYAEGPVLLAQDANASYLLTTLPDGARLSTQMADAPMVVTYLGQCEAAE